MITSKPSPAVQAAAALELRRRRKRQAVTAEAQDWEDWLLQRFPNAVYAPFAERHRRLWEWFEDLEPGVKPRAQIEIWPRGGGKSSTTELGVVRTGMRGARKFTIYVSGTQKQANKHVQAIAHRFELLGVGRAVNGFGNSLGWRMDLLRVSNGFSVLALGLDAAGRGVKIEDDRPDLIILDDVDARHEKPEGVQKKVETITESVLPTGAPDAGVLFVQNRIHSGSVATQLAEGTADFLLDRQTFEQPAVEGLQIDSVEREDGGRRYVIVAGTATWEGQNIEVCEAQLNEWGRASFLREAQHETDTEEDGLWQRERDIDPFRAGEGRKFRVPKLHRIGVAIDPNASEGNDAAGIMVGGIGWIDIPTGRVLHGYLLEDATVSGGPASWARAAVDAYNRWQADVMVAEKNNGGDMIKITVGTIPGAPPVKLLWASRGKQTRAEPVQKLYEDGRIHHAGVFVELEKELTHWKPGMPSPNRLDSVVWLFTELMLGNQIDPEAFTASTKK